MRLHKNFFVDPEWKQEGLYSPLMFPFWGNFFDPIKTPFHHALFEKYSFDTKYYDITDDPEKADMVLMPFSHNIALRHYPHILEACTSMSAKIKKPLLIDGIGDIVHEVTIPNTFVLRYGGYKFEKKPNEIVIPPYADDLLEIYCKGILPIREKSVIPTIGFAGWSNLTGKQKFRSFAKEFKDRLHGIFNSNYRAKKKGVFFRAQALKILEESFLLKTSIVRRSSYSGHADTVEGGAELVRLEFVENLLGCDYGLDVRGDANASIRLFEILSLGRIPIIIDTERNFPFSDKVDYSRFACIVDFRDMHILPQKIMEFHNSLSNEKYKEMQQYARDSYVKYFRVDALMQGIIQEIDERM